MEFDIKKDEANLIVCYIMDGIVEDNLKCLNPELYARMLKFIKAMAGCEIAETTLRVNF